MSAVVTLIERDGPRPITCPGCGEDVRSSLVEWDAVLQRWHCAVCGYAWRLAHIGRVRRVQAGSA